MSGSRPASRRRSREAALQVLYAVDLARGRDDEPRARLAEEALADAARHFELPESARAFAAELVHGVTKHREEIDALLAAHAQHWRLERMATVDRNVLRLGAYELLHGGLPPAVAIDEALELARRYGAERSPGFVNGILDALARTLPGASG